VDYLKEISARCRRLYWLNPQPRNEWDKNDSIMSIYASFCNSVFECRNLRQLEEVANKIL